MARRSAIGWMAVVVFIGLIGLLEGVARAREPHHERYRPPRNADEFPVTSADDGVWLGTAPFCDVKPDDCIPLNMNYVRSDPWGDGRGCFNDLIGVSNKVFCQKKPPPGPYLGTCSIRWRGTSLKYWCYETPEKKGNYREGILPSVDHCRPNSIVNRAGVLSCERDNLEPPAGPYRSSCSQFEVWSTVLTAKCKANNGSLRATKLHRLLDCKPGSITAKDGVLDCELANGRRSGPDGPFKQDSEAWWMEGGTLTARLGGGRELRLPRAISCRPGTIVLHQPGAPGFYGTEPTLGCTWESTGRTSLAPRGPYETTCPTENNLTRCRFRGPDDTINACCGGEPRTLERADQCRPDTIRMVDGRLGCLLTLPDGDYRSHCYHPEVKDGVLSAFCPVGNGVFSPTRLPDLAQCKPGTIAAVHGNLLCTYSSGQPSLPEGAYREACTGLRIEAGTLKGRCTTAAREVELRHVAECKPGSVVLDEIKGRHRHFAGLHCTYASARPSVPPGSYRASCTGLHVTDDDTLFGECDTDANVNSMENPRQQWMHLYKVGDCLPGTIVNKNNALSCQRPPGGVRMEGKYQDLCKNVVIDRSTGALTASCQTEFDWGEGAPHKPFSFTDVRRCQPGTMEFKGFDGASGGLECKPDATLQVQGCDLRLYGDDKLVGSCGSLLNASLCKPGTVRNEEDALVCTYRDGLPFGPFRRHCTDVSVTDGILTTTCTKDRRETTLHMPLDHCKTSISAKDGVLSCDANPKRFPVATSCRDLQYTSDDRLRGNCGADTALRDVSKCLRTRIADGRLVCDEYVSGHVTGSFRDSCAEVSIEGGALVAQCGNHKARLPGLRLCDRSGIELIGNQLQCPLSPAALPAGCTKLVVRGDDDVEGRCGDRNVVLYGGGRCVGPIKFVDGQLRCDYPPDYVAGSFRRSCSPVSVEGEHLSATCRGFPVEFIDVRRCVNGTMELKPDGRLSCAARPELIAQLGARPSLSWYGDDELADVGLHDESAQWLTDVSECIDGTVKRANGRLVCVYRPGFVSGRFRRSCTDVTLRDNALAATCKRTTDNRRGRVQADEVATVLTAIPDVRRCRFNSIRTTSEGRLECQTRPEEFPGEYRSTCTGLIHQPDDDRLLATCAESEWRTKLESVSACVRGSIRASGSNLKCEHRADFQGGPYLASCGDVSISPAGVLTARCAGTDNKAVAVRFSDVRRCEPGTMKYSAGKLACEPNPKVLPEWDRIAPQCTEMTLFTDGLMKGFCGTSNHQVSFEVKDLDACQPGSLQMRQEWYSPNRTEPRCRYPSNYQGDPFRDSCSDITIGPDGLLAARCKRDDGGRRQGRAPVVVKLPNVRLCEPGTITLVDDTLRCRPRPESLTEATRSSCFGLFLAADGTLQGECADTAERTRSSKAVLKNVGQCRPGSIHAEGAKLSCEHDAELYAAAAKRLGLTVTGFAIFELLNAGGSSDKVDEAKTELASILEEQLAPQLKIVDWVNKDAVQQEMRRLIKRQMRAAGHPADKVDAIVESVVDLLKRRNAR